MFNSKLLFWNRNEDHNMEIEEDKDDWNRWNPLFKRFYTMFLMLYVALLVHMIVSIPIVSAKNNTMTAAFSSPLVIVTLLLPFHMELTVSSTLL
jgi:hypothetical protein